MGAIPAAVMLIGSLVTILSPSPPPKVLPKKKCQKKNHALLRIPLLHMCPHTPMCPHTECPHPTTYVSAYYHIRVLYQHALCLCASSFSYVCVLILLCMCPRTTKYVCSDIGSRSLPLRVPLSLVSLASCLSLRTSYGHASCACLIRITSYASHAYLIRLTRIPHTPHTDASYYLNTNVT